MGPQVSQIQTGLARGQLRFEGRQIGARSYAGSNDLLRFRESRLLAIYTPLSSRDHFRFVDADARKRSRFHQILDASKFLLSQFDSLAFGGFSQRESPCRENQGSKGQ